jgi:hypothetical protein
MKRIYRQENEPSIDEIKKILFIITDGDQDRIQQFLTMHVLSDSYAEAGANSHYAEKLVEDSDEITRILREIIEKAGKRTSSAKHGFVELDVEDFVKIILQSQEIADHIISASVDLRERSESIRERRLRVKARIELRKREKAERTIQDLQVQIKALNKLIYELKAGSHQSRYPDGFYHNNPNDIVR